jgi:hypothetical protein
MKDAFATIYETWFGIYSPDYDLIYTNLYDGGGYIKLGLSFALIPLLLWLLFYFLWRYPYGKIWHWLIWLGVSVVVVFSVSYGIANSEIFASGNQALNDALADSSTGYMDYAASLPWRYAFVNMLFTLVLGFIYSLILKQFSKIQIHLPF